MLRKINAIATKEFYHLLRDYRSLILAFAVPVMLILLFGYALDLNVDNVKTVVVDYDKSPQSRDFLRSLDASPYFSLTTNLKSTRQIDKILDGAQAKLAIVIPQGWAADLTSGREAPLQAHLDGSNPNIASITKGYLTAFVEWYNGKLLKEFVNTNALGKLSPPVDLRVRIWFNEELESRSFILPAIIAIVIIIVGALLTSLVIAREYENGTMETLKSLPINALELIIGKAMPYFIVSLTDVIIAVFLAQFLFGIVMKGSFLLLALASVLYLSVAVAIGLLISTAVKSQLVANQLALVVTFLPSFLLSDFIFPQATMPKFLQGVVSVIPATYYIDILYGIYLRSANIYQILPSLAVLLAMFFILMTLGYLILRKEVG
ncbi:MAG: ABC transporter permease [Deltaproteobacteria bacterium]|nr:ABC transporter permease [Deltaproteobacteria bacterium]